MQRRVVGLFRIFGTLAPAFRFGACPRMLRPPC